MNLKRKMTLRKRTRKKSPVPAPATKPDAGPSPSVRSPSPDAGSVELEFKLPPSTNKLYQKTRHGGKALTKEAQEFREHVKQTVVNNLHLLNIPTDQETVYQFKLRAYFEKLENPGWFEFWPEDKFYTKDIAFKSGSRKGQVQFRKGELKHRKGERKAQSRYKIIDVDNRVKFLQDCVAKSVGIPDDCQIFRSIQEKHECEDNPRAVVNITVIPMGQFFRG